MSRLTESPFRLMWAPIAAVSSVLPKRCLRLCVACAADGVPQFVGFPLQGLFLGFKCRLFISRGRRTRCWREPIGVSRSRHKFQHRFRIVEAFVCEDLTGRTRLCRFTRQRADHQSTRRTADGGQLHGGPVIGRDKTEIDVECLSRLSGGATDERQLLFFFTSDSCSSHRPASCKTRRTVLGVTSGTH